MLTTPGTYQGIFVPVIGRIKSKLERLGPHALSASYRLVVKTGRKSPERDSLRFRAVRFGRMRTGIVINVSPADRTRLEAVVSDRNSPQKHVWRARIVLLSAAGCGTNEIMREAGVAKTAV